MGLGIAPDYAARFRADLNIEKGGGKCVFFLRSHKGARLLIDGALVTETPEGNSDVAEASGEAMLGPGWHKVELSYYETVGAAQLDLTWMPPGRQQEAIPARQLLQRMERSWAVRSSSVTTLFICAAKVSFLRSRNAPSIIQIWSLKRNPARESKGRNAGDAHRAVDHSGISARRRPEAPASVVGATRHGCRRNRYPW